MPDPADIYHAIDIACSHVAASKCGLGYNSDLMQRVGQIVFAKQEAIRDAIQAPDGKTWRSSLFEEAERRGNAEAEIERLRADLEKSEQWADRYTLPCDVRLPPNTTIRKGCSLKTLIVGLTARERIEGGKPLEFRAAEQSTVKEG